MSQAPMVIEDGSGASVLTQTSNALAALISNSSAATEPTTKYACQFWADTANDKLKQRNAANNAWIDVLTLSTGKPIGLVIGVDVPAFDAQLSSLIRQNSQSADYTCVLADSGKHIFHPSADTSARIFTIPANSSVAYPIGTALTFVNQASAGSITIAITSDTMRLAGAGSTGSRTLAANGIATAIKITSTEWIINGTGLS